MTVGLFILDQAYNIVAWNDWMQTKTTLLKDTVLGENIKTIFPDINYKRFEWALEQVLGFGAPQILSQLLNKFLIPIPLSNTIHEYMEHMQQHIEILAIPHEGKWMAMVVIRDVTDSVHQKNMLMQLGQKFEEESYHDALTGAHNRRYLWEHLQPILASAKREEFPVACVMYDLDHFKLVNDDYGHDMGDKVLLLFVKLMNELKRKSDVFIRYGGEEFLVIMSHCSAENALQQATRILKAFKKEAVTVLPNEALTCSAGIAVYSSENGAMVAEELIEHADKALYQAKEDGRNRIVVY